MYKHILVPTDGSDLSASAAVEAVKLAKSLGARVTGLHVIPARPVSVLEAWGHRGPDSAAELNAFYKKTALRYLVQIADRAREAGVRCQCLHVAGEQVFEEIIKAAKARRCDLICMASHGKRGTTDIILGSETVKVLTHSPIPVLVHRRSQAKRPVRKGSRTRA